MHQSEKLLLLAGLGRELYGRWRLPRIVTAMVRVIILAITAAVMISALIIMGIYSAYLLLLAEGVSMSASLLMAALVALLLTMLLLNEIRRQLFKVKTTSISTPVGDIMDSFLDGLLSEPSAPNVRIVSNRKGK